MYVVSALKGIGIYRRENKIFVKKAKGKRWLFCSRVYGAQQVDEARRRRNDINNKVKKGNKNKDKKKKKKKEK